MFTIPDWMLNQTAQIKTYIGNTGKGIKYSDTLVTIRCRFEEKESRESDYQREANHHKAIMFVNPNVSINENDLVLYDNNVFKVKKVLKQYALNTMSHKEVSLAWDSTLA